MVRTKLKSLVYPALLLVILGCAQLLAGCAPSGVVPIEVSTPIPDYIAQSGDTLPALASHFNTTEAEILKANPFIPAEVTTMPPGMPMKIPVYYAPFWGSPFQILPDSQFVNGPSQVGFSTAEFVRRYPGWLSNYREYASGAIRSASEIIDLVALNYSISPRIFLALLEYQAGALTQPLIADEQLEYVLGEADRQHRGFYLQLIWAANTLNNGYYGWRDGSLVVFDLLNDRQERPDPWQNAASVALQYYFSLLLDPQSYLMSISAEGFAHTYQQLFGDAWPDNQPHIPGSLQQPVFKLPFQPGRSWAYTGGPHTGWGEGEPLAAIDFAPGAETSGCIQSQEWGTAIADGIIARSETGVVVLDVDGDGDERTGWIIYYLHVAAEGRAPLGKKLAAGDPVGHPSCEGGRATGSHIHIARRYNGEWILADGPLAFNLEGWIVRKGFQPYQGFLVRGTQQITACECADQESQITSEGE
jgi:LasA protease